MTLQGTNTYLIGTGTSRILLDTAQGVPDYLKNLKSHMQQQGVTSLSAILLSHWHHDHTGGLADVRGLLAPGGAVYKGLGSKLLPAGVLTANPGLAESIVPIVDGQVFRTEGATLTALHTPGHTEDHHCFLLEEEQAVFSGDTILGAGTAVFQDLHAYMHSLRRIHRANPRRIYPAHGPLIDGDNDESAPRRIEQYIAHREQREAQIVELLRSQRKADSQDAAAASGDDSEALTTQQIVEKICQWISALQRLSQLQMR
jgi:glyoxylase-like metal-dependent hydrolase (beta-lactamase superfamily II)